LVIWHKSFVVRQLLLLLSFVICHSSFASPSASLEGVVTIWSSSETVVGIAVTASGEDRPVTRETTSDSSGRFRFPLLPPGRYSVTAAAPGYSTVALVGVVVVPGEERRVRLEVTRTDDEESVTETVNAALQARGVDGGWSVPVMEAEQLPLLRGSIGEVAALLPVVPSDPGTSEEEGSLPLEAVGHASVMTSTAGAAVGRVHANRLVVVPRWGSGRMQGSVRLVRGERVTSDGNVGTEAGGSWDDWFRGALTLGGAGHEGSFSGFLAIDHDERGLRRSTRSSSSLKVRSSTGWSKARIRPSSSGRGGRFARATRGSSPRTPRIRSTSRSRTVPTTSSVRAWTTVFRYCACGNVRSGSMSASRGCPGRAFATSFAPA
jgi:hypothetical protein